MDHFAAVSEVVTLMLGDGQRSLSQVDIAWKLELKRVEEFERWSFLLLSLLLTTGLGNGLYAEAVASFKLEVLAKADQPYVSR